MYKRNFIIKNYRNIGIKKEEKLLLNCGIDKDDSGSLVIVIGPNNSGKSNLLQSLLSFSDGINENDITNLSFDDEDKDVVLSLVDYEKKIINKNNRVEIIFSNYDKQIDNFKKKLLDICKVTNANELITFINSNNFDEIKNLIEKTNSGYYHSYFNNHYEQILKDQMNNVLKNNKGLFNFFNQITPQEKKDIKDIIKIINLDKINTNFDFCSDVNYIKSNNFYLLLFNKIKYDHKKLINVYETYKKQSNKGFLIKAEEEINKKLKEISNDFNKMYSFNIDNYDFKVSLDKDGIDFVIYKNNIPQTFKYQSVGFKYFFNLYFNDILSKINHGDILIMDEPGVHLHVSGQKELRSFLKKLAYEKSITIIFSTHSPFLIDLDNLDELRIIESNENGFIKIYNKFHCIEDETTDVLENIKKTLTINNNVLFEDDAKLIFVEGITDYNYLTAIKKILCDDYKKIFFIPINGLGRNKIENENRIREIKNFANRNCFLLVDDDHVGKQFRDLSKNELNVITLSEINAKYNNKSIEQVFDESDQKLLGEKKFEDSVSFKKNIEKYNLSNNTKENFEEIFKYLYSI